LVLKKNMNFGDPLKYLESVAEDFFATNICVYETANILLKDERFNFWSGSSLPHQHHYGTRGLVQHTAETVNLCLSIGMKYEWEGISYPVLFLASLFHDSGKMYDYECVNGFWQGTEHKRMIHHISRSGIYWNDAVKTVPDAYEMYFEQVLHCILSHHTSRIQGSPVAPKSREAWILTLCDNISARINDADTNDLLKNK